MLDTTKKMLATALACAAVMALTGCGDDGGGGDTDTSVDAWIDGYPPDQLPVATDLDFEGCPDQLPNGSATDTMVSATFVVADFEDDFAVEGVQLEVFYSNSATGTPDLDATNLDETDENGEVTALVPGGRSIAYRVVGGETPLYPPGVVQTSIEYDVPTPDADGLTVDAISVSQHTYMLISTVLGITPDPAKGILAGGFKDCSGDEIEGVVARMYDSTGGLCQGENECLDRYFIDDVPAQDQWWSSADGLFGVLQIPAGEGYRLELHGLVAGSGCPGDMVILGSHDDIRIIPNAITILDFDCTGTDEGAWSTRCVW